MEEYVCKYCNYCDEEYTVEEDRTECPRCGTDSLYS